jgi:hypothetical protein
MHGTGYARVQLRLQRRLHRIRDHQIGLPLGQALVDLEGHFNDAALEVVEIPKKLAETQSLAAKAANKANGYIGALKSGRERDDLVRYRETLDWRAVGYRGPQTSGLATAVLTPF